MTTLARVTERAADLLFGCWHTDYSWPITRGRGREAVTTVCCLNCGSEFFYDLQSMKVKERVQ
jgi:hypothetical protein